MDLDEGASGFGGSDVGVFNDGVGEEPGDDPVELVVGEGCLDEVDSAPMCAFEGDAYGFGVLDQGVSPRVAGVGGGVDLYAVDGVSCGEIGR